MYMYSLRSLSLEVLIEINVVFLKFVKVIFFL